MSARVRLTVFLVSAVGVGLLLLWGAWGLPAFGHYKGPYGTILDKIAVQQRHGTDVVALVTFDYRGFDTVGEEFILFTSAAGIALLLRTERDEEESPPPLDDAIADARKRTSEAVRVTCLALVAPAVLLGIYVITHGHLTPGGGFQGGVILASAVLLIYLAGEYGALHALLPEKLTEKADAVGAAGFVLIGLIGLVTGAAYLQNVVPLGPIGALYSAGMIPYINLSVGLEVGAAFLLILLEFFRQTLQIRARQRQRRHEQE